ncbi:MAG: NYN domain-containing protein, partial [Bradyrhizobium sp.]
SLVEAVQRRGVRVTVVSTISSQPPMIADELRRQADVFTDLVELQPKLGRKRQGSAIDVDVRRRSAGPAQAPQAPATDRDQY